jgi:hypothetical protein
LEKNWCETDKKKAKKKEKKMRLRFDSLLHGCEEKGAEEKSIRERRTPHEKQRSVSLDPLLFFFSFGGLHCRYRWNDASASLWNEWIVWVENFGCV